MKKIADEVSRSRDGGEPLLDAVQEFKDFIERDPVIYMGFHQMCEQVPTVPPYVNDPTGQPQVRASVDVILSSLMRVC